MRNVIDWMVLFNRFVNVQVDGRMGSLLLENPVGNGTFDSVRNLEQQVGALFRKKLSTASDQLKPVVATDLKTLNGQTLYLHWTWIPRDWKICEIIRNWGIQYQYTVWQTEWVYLIEYIVFFLYLLTVKKGTVGQAELFNCYVANSRASKFRNAMLCLILSWIMIFLMRKNF